jgi:hypothetical protein
VSKNPLQYLTLFVDTPGGGIPAIIMAYLLQLAGYRAGAIGPSENQMVAEKIGVNYWGPFAINPIIPEFIYNGSGGIPIVQLLAIFGVLPKIVGRTANLLTSLFSQGEIDQHTTIIANSAMMLLLGPTLDKLGIEKIIVTDPYLFVDLLGSWETEQGQIFPSRLLQNINRWGLLTIGQMFARNFRTKRILSKIKHHIILAHPNLVLSQSRGEKYSVLDYLPMPTVPNHPEVKEFVQTHKYVVLTLGSMQPSEEKRKQIVAAVYAGLPEDVYLLVVGEGIDSDRIKYFKHFMNYDELFGNALAIVSHAGAGTSHSIYRSGKPAVIFTFFPDQGRWAWRLTQLGLCVGYMPISKFDAATVTQMVKEALATPAQTKPVMPSISEPISQFLQIVTS